MLCARRWGVCRQRTLRRLSSENLRQKVEGDLAQGVVVEEVSGMMASGTSPKYYPLGQRTGAKEEINPWESHHPVVHREALCCWAPREAPHHWAPRGSTGQIQCYTCGALGHVCYNCPDCWLAGTKESRRHHGHYSFAGDPVDETIGGLMGTTYGVSGGERQQRLRPTIRIEVYFEGSPVRTMVDTSPPATTVELKFAPEVLAAQQDPEQSPPEWASYEEEGCSIPLLPYRAMV